jgi:hypothetical protein
MRTKGFLGRAAALLLFGASALIAPTHTAMAQSTPTATATPASTIPNNTELGEMLKNVYTSAHDSERVRTRAEYNPKSRIQRINTEIGSEYRFFDGPTHTAYVFRSAEHVLSLGDFECKPANTPAEYCGTPSETKITIDVYSNVDGLAHLERELEGTQPRPKMQHDKRYNIIGNSDFEAEAIQFIKNPTPVQGSTLIPKAVVGETYNAEHWGSNWVETTLATTDDRATAVEGANQILTHYVRDLTFVQNAINLTNDAYEVDRDERAEALILTQAQQESQRDIDRQRRVDAIGDLSTERSFDYATSTVAASCYGAPDFSLRLSYDINIADPSIDRLTGSIGVAPDGTVDIIGIPLPAKLDTTARTGLQQDVDRSGFFGLDSSANYDGTCTNPDVSGSLQLAVTCNGNAQVIGGNCIDNPEFESVMAAMSIYITEVPNYDFSCSIP